MPRILTPATHSEETLEIAHDLLPPGWELATAPHGRPEFLELLKDTEYYIGAGQFKHGPEFYQAAPKLRIVQTLSAGYNTYDLDAARAAGVPICNNGGANATAVAEHAMMLMLAVCRKLIWQHEGVVSGPLARQRLQLGQALRARRQDARHHRARQYRQEGRAPRQGLRHAHQILRHQPADDRPGGRARRPLCAVPRAVEDLRHRDPARAARQIDAQSDRRARIGDDEADRDPDQHLPRPGRRREGALHGACATRRSSAPGSTSWSRSRPSPTTNCSR